MDKFFKNKFITIMVIIILFFVGFMAGAVSSGVSAVPNNFFGSILSPIQDTFSRIWNSGGNLVESYTQYDKLLEENKKLKLDILEKETSLAEFDRYRLENEQLKQLLKITENNPDFVYCAADVVSADSSSWNSVFTINRGTRHGIEKLDPVITPEGLVGFISEVGYNYAKIQTITHESSAVSALVTRTHIFAIAEGDFALSQKGFLKLNYLNNSVLLNRGDIIETSGVGDKFPEGIRIGRIESVVSEYTGVSQHAVITPAVDFSMLRNVYVITDFKSDN